jgi:hypothetical protein
MVWLFDGGAVKGGIRYHAVGNRGCFLGDHRSARVDRPAGLARLAARTNWDGAGREHLCNLRGLPRDGFRFFAIPLRIAGGASFPVRAFAELASANGGSRTVGRW